MVQEVADSLSNTPEHIQEAAKAIGKSKLRLAVFEAIYFHKTKVKTVADIAKRTRLSEKQVLQEGKRLARRHIVEQTKAKGGTAYIPKPFFQEHKRKILSLVESPAKLAKWTTKRSVRATVVVKTKVVNLRTTSAKVRLVTIDDIASFAKVKRIKPAGHLPSTVSETAFKNGVQRIVAEPGEFKDWGGEHSDLYTTRVLINGKRVAAAFAFKGPGLKTKLVPRNMGKNGDQALRLFQEPAQMFFVQHWREKDPSVVKQMQHFALARSTMTGTTVMYGIIDGVDSMRLYRAYEGRFKKASKQKR